MPCKPVYLCAQAKAKIKRAEQVASSRIGWVEQSETQRFEKNRLPDTQGMGR